ncbi:MAG: DUF4232 domain-containing protein [Gaiellaceae bacterium]
MSVGGRPLCAVALAAAGVIPWTPASPPRPRTPALAPACRLEQLQVSGADRRRGVFFNGATGSLVGAVRFRNRGAPCSLVGRPRVHFLGGGATSARIRQVSLPPDRPAADVLPPPFSVRALPRGRSAAVEIWWSNWCGPGSSGGGGPYLPPATVALTLPSGGSLRLKVAEAPRCDAPSLTSQVSVGRFEPYVPQPSPSTRLPLRLGFAAVPQRVAADSTLRFRITLTNGGRRPFRFHSCPTYFEALAMSSWHEVHDLNCHLAGSLAPGARAVFAMELCVPRGTKPGLTWIVFELGLGTFLPIQATGPQIAVAR